MSGTSELLGIRSGTVARAVLVCGTVRCAESAAASCRVTNRRQCRAIGLRLCRVSVLCRVVLLCCVVLVGAECTCCVGWRGLVWSVSCARVWSVSCTLVSSRIRIGWLVYRIGTVLCRVVLCRVSVLDRIVLRIVYVYGLVWSCYVSCGRVVRIGLVWLYGSVRIGSVSSRVLDRFGIRAERHAERLCIATRIAPPTRRIRRQCDNICELKIYTMTYTLSNFKFQIYYSNDFKLYDLVITYNNQFHSHYHLSNKKQINKIINKTLKQLK